MKIAKSFKNLFVICFICLAVVIGGSYFSTTAKAENILTLKKGNYAEWIDRIDFGEYKGIALDFYEWLVENSDNDGVDDGLINPTDAEIFQLRDGYGNPNGKVQYVYTFNVFSEDVTYSGSNPNTVIAPKVQKNIEISQEIMTTVYAAFNRDNPQVFWLSGNVNYGDYYEIQQVSANTYRYTQWVMFIIKSSSENYDLRSEFFSSTGAIREAISTMDAKIDEILSGISEDFSDYEKVKYFNEYLTHNNCYRKGEIKMQSYISYFAILGRTGDSEEAPVCEGYARSFKVLCDRSGVECILEDGYAGEPHMWNVVKIDGVWYNTDVTWNDPSVSNKTDKVSGSERESYLLVGSETEIYGYTFAERHATENAAYQGIICFTNGPKISKTAYESGVVKTWDVSKTAGVDSVKATLSKAKNYSESQPLYDLVISGNGKMQDFTVSGTPWSSYAANIETVTVRNGVEQIGNYAFNGLEDVVSITINGYVTTAGDNTFYNVGSNVTVNVHDASEIKDKCAESQINVKSLCSYSWAVKSPATCTSVEILLGTCDCGNTVEKEGDPKLDHNFTGDYEYNNDGHWSSCQCGEVGPLTDHQYGVWMVTKQPSYTEKGERSRKCVCGKIETQEIDMLQESSSENQTSETGTKETGNTPDKQKKGCKSSVGGLGGFSLLSLAVGSFIFKKKQD